MDVASTDNDVCLRLVGGAQVLPVEGGFGEMMGFYGRLFDRLPREVRHAAARTRYMSYQSPRGRERLHFLGLEVERIADIPAGLVAWELTEDTLRTWESQDGRDVVSAEQPLQWRWRSLTADGRLAGEFAAGGREFWISANAPVDLAAKDADADEILIADYDPSWPAAFEEFAAWLRGRLGPGLALRLEHIGSTAIPGMPAKPVIDVLVEVAHYAAAKPQVVPLLAGAEWEYWWYTDHMVFIKRDRLMGRRTTHVHFMKSGPRVREHLAFRDSLRIHPEDAARYASLKRDLAAAHRGDRERYTQAKTAFIREVLTRAIK
jgi:GrpB-like predicted nucleotidyltransferase (UPF0157 family)